MRDALARHDAIVRGTVESRGGVVFSTMGDGMAAVFASARDAVGAVLAAQAERSARLHHEGLVIEARLIPDRRAVTRSLALVPGVAWVLSCCL